MVGKSSNCMNLQKLCAQKDLVFINALHRIRICQPSNGSPEDELLCSCELGCVPGDATYPYSAMHVYAQNVYCDEWNEYMLDRLDGDMVMCIAKDQSERHINKYGKYNDFQTSQVTLGICDIHYA